MTSTIITMGPLPHSPPPPPPNYLSSYLTKKHEIEKQEYTVLDEITKKEIPKEPENQNVQQQEQ
jgi:hypothetical protein